MDFYSGYTPYSRYAEAPVQFGSPYYYYPRRAVPVQPRQVVSIPVQYAAPERRRSDPRSDAALKIQKAFRGFLVRKSVSKIVGIKRDVEEISERVSKEETADLVRTDAKERLKVVETLMSLLLKLDSVKGVDYGVRELRRSVIKKAIALQEKVEASAANHQTHCEHEATNSNLESSKQSAEASAANHQPVGGHESAEPVTNSSAENSVEFTAANHQTAYGREGAEWVTNSDLKCEEQSGEGANERKSCCNKEEMLEKMVKENQRMVGLVRELVHRNDKQTQLLGSLSQRVEMLERALINERLRRKKRRQSLGCTEDFF